MDKAKILKRLDAIITANTAPDSKPEAGDGDVNDVAKLATIVRELLADPAQPGQSQPAQPSQKMPTIL